MINNRADLRSLKQYRETGSALLMCAICGTAALLASAWAVDHLPLFPQSFYTHIKSLVVDTSIYIDFIKLHKVRAIVFYTIPLFASTSSVIGAWLFFGRLIDPIIHVRGRRLWRGTEAIRRAKLASEAMLAKSVFGIELLKSIPISRDILLKSIMFGGAQGGGKTVGINTVILALVKVDAKMIIYDPIKGDFSRWVPMSAGLCLISSTDARSLHWWIGFDLIDEPDAQAFAEGLVESGSDNPIWANAARLILVGLIVHLQKTKGTSWSWCELSDMLNLNMEEMHNVFEQSYEPAKAFANPDSKTSQSIEMNLRAFTAPITRLAATWSRIDKKKRFSLRRWLDNDNTKHRRIIVQMNQRDAVLGAAISRAFLSYTTNHIASLEFSESNTRLLVNVLDEIPQFRKIEDFIKGNEVGRSKGVFSVIGFQDVAQIEQIYGKAELQKWSALFGLKIFPQVVGGESQRWVCDQVGDREVQYRVKNVSGVGAGQVNVSRSYSQPTTTQVILPSELELFGKTKSGIEALFLGLGKDALALTIPFPNIKDIRPAHVPWPPEEAKSPTHATAKEHEDHQSAQRAAHDTTSVEILPPEALEEVKVDDEIMPSVKSESDLQTTLLNIFENQSGVPNEYSDRDDAIEEAAGSITGNATTQAVAEAIGIPATAVDIIQNLAELDFEKESESGQIAIIGTTKKRTRKPRKYMNQNHEV